MRTTCLLLYLPGLGGASGPGGSTWSGREGCTWSGGCTWSWGVYLVLRGAPGPGVYLVWGVYLIWGVYLVPGLGGCTWSQEGTCPGTPPVNTMTNRCKNITLPQTSFAGGKNKVASSGTSGTWTHNTDHHWFTSMMPIQLCWAGMCWTGDL